MCASLSPDCDGDFFGGRLTEDQLVAQLKRMDAARTEVDAGKSPGETALQSAANDVSSAIAVTTAWLRIPVNAATHSNPSPARDSC